MQDIKCFRKAGVPNNVELSRKNTISIYGSVQEIALKDLEPLNG